MYACVFLCNYVVVYTDTLMLLKDWFELMHQNK